MVHGILWKIEKAKKWAKVLLHLRNHSNYKNKQYMYWKMKKN